MALAQGLPSVAPFAEKDAIWNGRSGLTPRECRYAASAVLPRRPQKWYGAICSVICKGSQKP